MIFWLGGRVKKQSFLYNGLLSFENVILLSVIKRIIALELVVSQVHREKKKSGVKIQHQIINLTNPEK